MRLASYRLPEGRATYGLVVEGGRGLVELPRHGLGAHVTLKAALQAGAVTSDALRAVATQPPDVSVDAVMLLPPIPRPDKILCVGVNYVAHREETGRSESKYPVLFTRFANTQVGHGQPLVRPRVSTMFDFEGELAVVIGRAGRHIPKERALEHVAGYACYMDASVRDWQQHTPQFTPGKNFVGTGGFGPFLVTAEEVGDPSKLELSTTVNGQRMQHATTDLMIFDVPALIAYITTFTELMPGDVIATGTPGGVGWKRTPPIYLKPGDVVEVSISRVGQLRSPVIGEATEP